MTTSSMRRVLTTFVISFGISPNFQRSFNFSKKRQRLKTTKFVIRYFSFTGGKSTNLLLLCQLPDNSLIIKVSLT